MSGSKRTILIVFILMIVCGAILSAAPDLQNSPDVMNINDFRTDRVAFHYIQLVDKEGKALPERNLNRDTSESTLLIIDRGQLTLLKDGFDDPVQIKEKEKDYLNKIYKFTRLKDLEQEYYKLPESERTKPSSKTEPNQAETNKPNASAATSSEPEEKNKEFDLLLKYDDELLKSYAAEKAAYAEYVRTERIYGKDSPKTSSLRARFEEVRSKTQERKKFLLGFLHNTSADSNPYPGDRKEQVFYTNHSNGVPDFYLHSTTPREVDGLMKGEEEVGKKYGQLFKTAVDRLIDSQIDKLYYYIWNRDMTNTRIKVDRFLKGKKVTVVTGDSTVYTMIDKEGDGITESFFVDSPGLKFSWGKEVPNIISISNCTDQAILAKIKALGDDVSSGRIPKKVDKLDLTIPEEQILLELKPLLKNL
ncbi:MULTISPECIES: hypothetical protein [unclassified Leptospira]|uniref:hypothetical protein n=1 Tax=unclassified Leptospira TaxID=2633828 RepID=UPI0002BD8C1C|nr:MULTISPECIES: hypothetical protein [unclassified Leptospira]EMK01418.1 hypothetical protein LEP1GSC192_2586 [Leptospira sp. B5-022]MCR1795504.1 hypothetical protein [Leptospira sp. id769339]